MYFVESLHHGWRAVVKSIEIILILKHTIDQFNKKNTMLSIFILIL